MCAVLIAPYATLAKIRNDQGSPSVKTTTGSFSSSLSRLRNRRVDRAGLALQVEQDGAVLLVEPVLGEPVDHAAALDRDDELRPGRDELDLLLLDVERDGVAAVADVVPAVDLLDDPLPVRLLDRQVADHRGAVLLRVEPEVLPQPLAEDLEVLDEEVRLVLAVELRPPPTPR